MRIILLSTPAWRAHLREQGQGGALVRLFLRRLRRRGFDSALAILAPAMPRLSILVADRGGPDVQIRTPAASGGNWMGSQIAMRLVPDRLRVAGMASRAFLPVGGLAVLLVTWIFLIPPAGGLDEYSHAFRAAAVARGQWTPVTSPTGLTRAGVDAPVDVVSAAHSQCAWLNYTTDSDCVGLVHGGSALVADSAARYHPAFYAIVGTAARPFEGVAALYVMRFATAALALLFVALALAALGTWARSGIAYLGLVVACTPMLVYSSSIVAPNGVEMTAALAFWASLIGLLVAEGDDLRRLVLIAAISGAVLGSLRSFGPLWCFLIGCAVVIAVRPPSGRLRMLLGRPGVLVAAAVVMLSAAQNVVWILRMGTLPIGQGVSSENAATPLGYRVGRSVEAVPVWLFQTIGGFPRRDPTYPAVYACYLLLFIALMIVAFGVSSPRLRVGLCALAVLSVVLPIVVTVQSYDATGGVAWQGRYELPLVAGLVMLGAYSLDRLDRPLPGPRGMAAALFVFAHVISAAYTLHLEIDESPLAHAAEWLRPPMWLVIVGSAIGATALWSASGSAVRVERLQHERDPEVSELVVRHS